MTQLNQQEAWEYGQEVKRAADNLRDADVKWSNDYAAKLEGENEDAAYGYKSRWMSDSPERHRTSAQQRLDEGTTFNDYQNADRNFDQELNKSRSYLPEDEAWKEAQAIKSIVHESKINEFKSRQGNSLSFYDIKREWKKQAQKNPDNLPLEAFRTDNFDYEHAERQIEDEITNEFLKKISQSEDNNIESMHSIGSVSSGTMICGTENRGITTSSPENVKAICEHATLGNYAGEYRISESVESMMKAYDLSWEDVVSASFQGSDLYGTFHQIIIAFDHPDGTAIYMASETSEYLDEGVHIVPMKSEPRKRSEQNQAETINYGQEMANIRDRILAITTGQMEDEKVIEHYTEEYSSNQEGLTTSLKDLIPQEYLEALEQQQES